MDITNSVVNFRRYLKRKNYSPHTVKNYLNMLQHFIRWLDVPVEEATSRNMAGYIDFLMDKRLHPKTINCHLGGIRVFYDFLRYEEGVAITNPVKKGLTLRLPILLPRYLKDEEVDKFFTSIFKHRDRAIFMLMLRCGLRVEEVAHLTIEALDLRRRRIFVYNGKGQKDRVVYISDDAYLALGKYLRSRPKIISKKLFLVEKGICKNQGISVRGIQKRIEYYARKAKLKISCHHLRHTMATQMLNADAELSTIQDLLGHNWITTTQRYCTVSNLKVQRDYFKAMETVMQRSSTMSKESDHNQLKH
jgi:site-specific recombinase XerD